MPLTSRGAQPAFRDYLTIKDAATLLGVTPETLRNWDRANKFKAHRHPVNGYRLYVRQELEALLAQATKSRRGRPSSRRPVPAS